MLHIQSTLSLFFPFFGRDICVWVIRYERYSFLHISTFTSTMECLRKNKMLNMVITLFFRTLTAEGEETINSYASACEHRLSLLFPSSFLTMILLYSQKKLKLKLDVTCFGILSSANQPSQPILPFSRKESLMLLICMPWDSKWYHSHDFIESLLNQKWQTIEILVVALLESFNGGMQGTVEFSNKIII